MLWPVVRQTQPYITRCLFAVSLLVTLLIPIAAHSKDTSPKAYATLPKYRAVAIHNTQPDVPYVTHSQPSKLAAANAAQASCLQANPQQNFQQYCELIQLGDQSLTTVEDILARQPQTPYPLYLWRYTSPTSTVYLAGSVHILKPGIYPLAKPYQQAFDASNNFVVEVDLASYTPQQLQFKTMQYALLENNQQLSDVLAPQTYAELNVVAKQYGLALEQMAKFKPAFITQQLAVLALMSVGYDPNQGVEKHFTTQLQNDPRKTIQELESLDFQLNLLMNQSLETQLMMVKDTLAQIDQFETYTADLIAAWRHGDDAAFLQAFSAQSGESPESQAFMRELMDKRNRGMADKIKGYLNTPGSYFVLIGAAHFIGENGIIELLQNEGLRGQRIFSNESLQP